MSGSKPAAMASWSRSPVRAIDEVEDLDDLGAEAAGELALAAERVLGGDRALACGRWCRAAGRWCRAVGGGS